LSKELLKAQAAYCISTALMNMTAINCNTAAMPSATLPAPMAMPPFPALPVPLVLLDVKPLKGSLNDIHVPQKN
jgi:hypothetical protein